MDIQQIRAFVAVATELHFGRAAEQLHMAQPPVSRSVQQLERELGADLFVRSTRRVALTSVGEALVGPATEVLDALARMRTAAQAAGRGEIGRVRLAYAGASSHIMMGRLARMVRQEQPGIQFELLSGHFAQPMMGMLARGEIDIALGRWDYVPTGIRTRVVAVEQLVVAVPETHRLADRDVVSMAEFAGEPFVSLPLQTGSILIERLRSLTRKAGHTDNVVQYAPDTWTVMSLVSAEVGCALTLDSVIDSIPDPHIRFLRLSDQVEPVEMRLAWRSDADDRALDAVLHISEQVLPTQRRTSNAR